LVRMGDRMVLDWAEICARISEAETLVAPTTIYWET
jgi:hypothetical protein